MRPASDDGDRLVRVPPERLSGWLERFAARHGEPALELTPAALRLTSPDGAAATLTLIWGPLPGVLDPRAELIEAMLRERRVAVLLVRRSAHAVGIVAAGLVKGTATRIVGMIDTLAMNQDWSMNSRV